jgi:hypothetical protein
VQIVTLEQAADSGDGGPSMDDNGSNVRVLQGQLEDLGPEQRERVLAHLIDRLEAFTRQAQIEAATSAHPTSHRAHPAPAPLLSSSRPTTTTSTGGPNNGLSLPSIPAFPRGRGGGSPDARSGAAASSNGGGNGGGGGNVGVAPWQLQLPGVGGGGGAAAGALRSMPTGTSPTGHAGGGNGGEPMEPMPAVDDLLSRVMSDVRPWGKKAGGGQAGGQGAGGLAAGRQGVSVFMKKGAVK